MSLRANLFLGKVVSRNGSVLAFLFFVTLVFYGNILFGEFVFDDNIFIENNVQIRSLANIGQIYQSSTTAGSGLTGDNFYRPNQQLIFAVLYSLFGLSPFFFHLVPVLFHVLNGFLIFLLFTDLGISRRSSLFGALIFLLHPVLTQAVSYVSGLSEPLVLSTILGTLLIFLKAMKRLTARQFGKLLFLGALVFSVGLFSKESQSIALGLLVLLAVFEYKRGELVNTRRAVFFIGSLAVISALYFYLRLNFLNFTGTLGFVNEVSVYTENLFVRLITFTHILPEYFKMMVWPWHLNYEKPYFSISSFTLRSVISILAVIAGLWLSLRSLVRENGKIFFGLGWFAVAMVPFTGLVPLNAIYLEHWLYIPIIGIIFCLCFFFDRYEKSSGNVLLYVLIIVLLLFGFRTMARNAEWGNPVKFYENEIRYTQSSARIYNNLGMVLSDKGNCDIAMIHYRKAISLNDAYPQTHHNLARCLEATGKTDEAFGEYLKALELQPDFPYSLDALRDLVARYPYLLNSSSLWRFRSP